MQKLFTIRSLFLVLVVLSAHPNKGTRQGVNEVKSALDAYIFPDETVLKKAKTPATAFIVIIKERNEFSGGIFFVASVSCKYPSACILWDMPVLRGGDCFPRSQT